MRISPLEQASAILGEHMTNYVIIVSSPENPQHAEMSYDSKYAAEGLIHHAKNIIAKEIQFDSEYDLVWDDEEDEE